MTKSVSPFDAINVAGDILHEAGFAMEPACGFPGEILIAVLDRNYNYVGRWHQRGSLVELRDCCQFGPWGVEEGLMELANNGPATGTVLRPKGRLRFREAPGLPVYVCNQDVWGPVLDSRK